MTLHFLREVDRLIDSLASFGEEVEDQLCLSIDSLLALTTEGIIFARLRCNWSHFGGLYSRL